MKKIFRLRGELVVSIIVSLILSWLISWFIVSIYRERVIRQCDLKTLVINKNNKAVEDIKGKLDIDSHDEEIVLKNIKALKDDSNYFDITKIFIVDNFGIVKSPKESFGIKQIGLNMKESDRLVISNNKYLATNIININSESFLVYINENYIYSDMMITQICVFLAFLIFTIMIKGRIKYISSIAKNVKKIASGDLTNRVNIKYKNELTELAEGVNYMASELQQQDLKQKEFITNISHDLRTPLTTILGYSRMIEDNIYSNEEELNAYISIINKKAAYLKTMLDNFFDYAKLSSKDMELDKVQINLNEIIMQLLDGEEVEFKEKKLDLQVKLDYKAIFTYADSLYVARAFSNLISNAKKYSKEDTIVTVRLKSENINNIEYGVFSIENTSKNYISREIASNLFKRLYKVDKARKKEGSGLGLAITQEIVKGHNGFIDVKLDNDIIQFRIGLVKL